MSEFLSPAEVRDYLSFANPADRAPRFGRNSEESNTMKKLILSLAILASFAAQAGQSTGVVSNVIPLSGVTLFTSSGTSSGQPACVTSAGRFAVSNSTVTGQSHTATLRMAAALGKTVTFVGDGTCGLNSGDESLAYAVITM